MTQLAVRCRGSLEGLSEDSCETYAVDGEFLDQLGFLELSKGVSFNFIHFA